MKFLIVLCTLPLIYHFTCFKETEKNTSDQAFTNISNLLNPSEFEMIKNFILEQGGRQTFRNFDNHNPYYHFDHIDAYLGADIGQKNINNDPLRSDFNQLTLRTRNILSNYFELIIVRESDISKKKYWIQEGMQENQVYLIGKLKSREGVLKKYLKLIRKLI